MARKRLNLKPGSGSPLAIESSFDGEGVARGLVDLGAPRAKLSRLQMLPDGSPMGRYPMALMDSRSDKGVDVIEGPQDAGAAGGCFVDGDRLESKVILF
jgi:hypothetical protein